MGFTLSEAATDLNSLRMQQANRETEGADPNRGQLTGGTTRVRVAQLTGAPFVQAPRGLYYGVCTHEMR